MAKSFYRLRDIGTSFFDMTQGAGVVADRVAPLENTARVKEAVRDGLLDKLEVAEGKAAYEKQQEEIAQQQAEHAKLAAQAKGQTIMPLADATTADRPTVDGGDGSNVAKTAASVDLTAEDDDAADAEQQKKNAATKPKK